MAKNLVIVESPAKAKTIEKFLGKDYTVVASFGHVRDLPKKGMSIDIEHGFAPQYEVSPDKKKVIAELKRLAKAADNVWLASDEDREGEAIAWHLSQALSLPKDTKRIVFHEITIGAITDALKTPRIVDQNLVDAQQARRILDRLVGYELSPVLWKKVRTGLSAGRVQSVAVRLIVEREREIEGFMSTGKFRIKAEFSLDGGVTLDAELPKKFDTIELAEAFLKKCLGADFTITSVETKPAKKSPTAPFTTSTLQQEASRKLGFSVKQTMVLAQKLYETGAITYMRTDSVHLSATAIDGAISHIQSTYGKEYVQTRQFKTKSAGAQEAHEAIRPTNFNHQSAGADSGQKRLYELIYKRTIASQMAEAKLDKTKVEITISTTPEKLIAEGEVIVFDGFLKVYLEGTDHEDSAAEAKMLPPLKMGEKLDLTQMQAIESFDRPKPRYTEASLVKALEEMGIGRPSTYAPTISTVQDRGYVEKADMEGVERNVRTLTLAKGQIKPAESTEITGAERSKLFPTDIGSIVTDFLVKHFPSIVDFHFTAKVEGQFDEIEDGKQTWTKMIGDFYNPFHKTVQEAEGISREEASGAKDIGIDPKSGKPIIARMGRFGAMLQLGSAEDEEKPKFAPLPAGKKIDTVTLEEALEQFKLPRVLGQTAAGDDIKANIGRFGPYVQYAGKYVSIKPDDPFTITLERALELIAAKEKTDAEKTIQYFEKEGISVLNGRYGPYITNGKKNAKIPKDVEPKKLTLKQCKELLEVAPAAGKRKRFVRKRS